MAKKAAKASSSSSKKASRANKEAPKDSKELNSNPQSTRETVESVVVAFILAFLFRAFVAEAFVIPTGSMAPTLMGAHKDIFCEHCGQQYQASGSSEYDSNTGMLSVVAGGYPKTLASHCPNCRGINAYDFENNPNHETFSGDRILVSKFDYVLSKPKRWDVFVFKYPRQARMNYIKRLVGLPGETLMLWHGDVFIETEAADGIGWRIARKPAHKVQAMKQLVHNTLHQPSDLVSKGWPSSWQPLASQANDSAWTVNHNAEEWSATLKNSSDVSWLRYYHKVPSVDTWQKVDAGQEIEPEDPYSSQLVTDFLAYNSPYQMTDARQLFDLKQNTMDRFLPGPFRKGPYFAPDKEKTGGKKAFEVALNDPTVAYQSGYAGEGKLHWVGDLDGEFEVNVKSDSGTILLDLVEYGIHFQCSIDVATGEAALQAFDGASPVSIFDVPDLNAQTGVRGAGEYRLELSNFDDQIFLWVNGSVVGFNGATTYDLSSVRSERQRRPYWSETDPLDAAPVGIGGKGVEMDVKTAQVYRDIYYIADSSHFGSFSDYRNSRISAIPSTVPDAAERLRMSNRKEAVVAEVYEHPEWWSQTDLFEKRAKEYFELADGDDPATEEIETRQYFPMGDNSAASSDARAWLGGKFVEERYLLGKALLVFFPHPWNTPVPFTPNIQRMGLIR